MQFYCENCEENVTPHIEYNVSEDGDADPEMEVCPECGEPISTSESILEEE